MQIVKDMQYVYFIQINHKFEASYHLVKINLMHQLKLHVQLRDLILIVSIILIFINMEI